MTGYAKEQVSLGDRKLNIEIKTLNSKQLDLIVKLPTAYRSKELEIRNMLSALERGKVELTITEEATAQTTQLNESLLAERLLQLKQAFANLGLDSTQALGHIITMPDLWGTATDQEISDDEWHTMATGIKQAIAAVDTFRSDEGAILECDFHKHIDLIEATLNQIPSHEQERITTARERIHRYMAEAQIKEVDANRFEQELIYYLEKFDITEEKVRLQKHIDYFRRTMAEEPSCGKKLGFVAQEMGREINTTGSKANHVEIQRLVVVMKDELEKIKEQLGNVL